MSFGRRGGERRLARATNARAPGAGTKNRTRAQETRPSLGPETRARQSSLCIGRKLDGEALAVASRLGKLAQAGGTNTGVIESGRSAARCVSSLPQGRQHGTSEKEGGRGLRPCEDHEPGFGCSHVVVCCRSRQAMPGLEYARQTRSKKSGQGRVNRDLALRNLRRVIPPLARSAKRRIASSNSLGNTGEDRNKAQGGERSPSSGCTIAKSGVVVAGPGL
jgi:hypothetical protein